MLPKGKQNSEGSLFLMELHSLLNTTSTILLDRYPGQNK